MCPSVRVELHCHSIASDGEETPVAMAHRAQQRGVELFALTDHDSCAGSDTAVAPGLTTVRAAELSCDDNGRTVHVLAFDTGGHWELLAARLDEVRQARRRRLRVMGARLEQRGVRVDVEAMLAAATAGGADRTVGRPDLARAMVQSGAVRTAREAFTRFLYDGGPVDVPHRDLPIGDAIALGRAAGAKMSLAHPHLYADRAEELFKTHRSAGLDGIEAYYASYDRRERERWLDLAAAQRLVCTGGSDFHKPGDYEPGVDLPPEAATRLYAWLGRE